MNIYEQDFYGWTQEQSGLLKAGRLSELDIENLIEEIDDMGRSESDKLESHLRVLLAHFLKWHYQPGKNHGRSWRLTIVEQRIRIAHVIRKNPGLKQHISELIEDA